MKSRVAAGLVTQPNDYIDARHFCRRLQILASLKLQLTDVYTRVYIRVSLWLCTETPFMVFKRRKQQLHACSIYFHAHKYDAHYVYALQHSVVRGSFIVSTRYQGFATAIFHSLFVPPFKTFVCILCTSEWEESSESCIRDVLAHILNVYFTGLLMIFTRSPCAFYRF